MQVLDFGFRRGGFRAIWILDFGLASAVKSARLSSPKSRPAGKTETSSRSGSQSKIQNPKSKIKAAVAAALCLSLLGCGRVISQKATEQLIAGDAVDRSVSQIDFHVFAGKKVFLDTQYVPKAVPGVGFVTSDYIVSSVRQKMMGDGCLLEEKVDTADFVVEMRIGALGEDGHEVIYGLPPNNFASIAASVVPSSPAAAAALPAMPELSFGKTDDQMAAAKIALFAFNKHTREPVWQSGISESRSTVADRWYFGAGPFHRGNFYSSHPIDDGSTSLFGSSGADEVVKSDYFGQRQLADPAKSLKEDPPAAGPSAASSTQPGVGAQGKLPIVSATAASAGTQQGSQPGLPSATVQKTASVPTPPAPGPAVPSTAVAPTAAANLPAATPAPPSSTTSSNRSGSTSATSSSALSPAATTDAFSGLPNLTLPAGTRTAFGDGLDGSPTFSGPSWNEQNLWTLSQRLP